MLTLAEELLLFSFHEKKKSVVLKPSIFLTYALAGALLAELTLQGKLCLEDNDKLIVVEGQTNDNTQSIELLDTIRAAKKPKKITHWVEVLGANNNKLQRELVEMLIAKGVLQENKKRLLWVIPYVEYSPQDVSAKFWRKQQLRGFIFGGENADQRSIALLSLLNAARILDHVFTEDEIKAARKRIENLVEDEKFGQAVIETVDAIAAAAAAAAMAATTV